MSDLLIQAENISKRYRLGVLNANSLREDVSLWWRKKVSKPSTQAADVDPYFWALKDINFEIKRGDVVGLIGKNGAGKSTLLKIISRIALPTTGIVRGKGRVASLLEVGTGFHPELSGRENIFLNGNILGMKKKEVEARFDEIVDFSEVEAFLDTPVKRYSSGMYVRLAFSIAIHLNPDILILDEVLSVGDFDFQKKCLSKIEDLSKSQGQTILFVSHSMQSVKTLCNSALYLEKGKLVAEGDATSVISKYLLRENVYVPIQEFDHAESAPGNAAIRIRNVEILSRGKTVNGPLGVNSDASVLFSFWKLRREQVTLYVRMVVIDFLGECIFTVDSEPFNAEQGVVEGGCVVPEGFLSSGSYVIHLIFMTIDDEVLFEFTNSLSFEVASVVSVVPQQNHWTPRVRADFPFSLSQTT